MPSSGSAVSEPTVPPEQIGAQETPVAAESVMSQRELQDVNLRSIVWFTVILLAAVGVVHIILWGLLQSWTDRPLLPRVQIAPVIVTPPPAPGPGIQAAPPLDLDAFLEAELEQMNSYGWVDREAGKIRIPVERAMELLVERGLPACEGATPDFGLEPAYQLDSSGGQGIDVGAKGE